MPRNGNSSVQIPAFLAGGGEMGALMRAHDWSATPLGPPNAWPQGLRTAVRLLLNTGHPMYIWWGPDLLCFYNDAYRPSIGPERHPSSLGRPGREVWDEIWPIIGPQIEQVMSGGGATWRENDLVPITRNGRLEDVYWTYSYGPIDDEGAANGVGGVLVVCTETTATVLAEQRRAAEAERQRRLFEQAPGFITVLGGPDHIFEFVNQAYIRLFGDRDFIGKTVREAFPELAGQAFFGWLDNVYETGERFIAQRVPIELQRSPTAAPERRYLEFIYEPVTDEAGQITGIFCEGQDVTEAHLAQEALRESEERLRFLDRLAEVTQPLTDPTSVMTITAQLLGEHLGVAICAYADMEPDQDGFTIRGDWTAPGAASIVGFYRLSGFGETAVKELRAGRPLVTRDTLAELGPDQAALFLRLGLQATICMPLVKEGRLTALMAVHSASPRDWSPAELELVGETTQRSWAHIERVRSEVALRESEARFRAAVQAVEGVLWTNDASGRMVGEQPGWAALTGQTFDEYQGHGWGQAVHPDDAQPTIEAWSKAVTQRKTFVFEHRVRRHDGEWRDFAIRAVPALGLDGSVREWVGVHTDITEARQAEAALREESRTLETLNRTGAAIAGELELERVVQSVTDAGVALIGAQFGAFFYNVLNDAGESYMLYKVSGAERSAFDGFGMPPAPAVFRPTFMGEGVIRCDDILADERYGKNQPRRGIPEGGLPLRSYLAVPVMSRSGEVIGGLFFGHPEPARFTERHEQLLIGIAGQAAIAIDNARLYQAVQRSNETLEQRVAEEIAERTKAEEALRQAQKMEAIGQLTGGVAHDFNNLLTIIKSSTDLLRRPDLMDERRRRYVDAISETVDRASKLTGQLLAFARRQALKPEVFDAAERLRSIIDMLRSIVGGRIQIATQIAHEACFIEADVSQFETALINMTVNARDAMEGEGILTIRVEGVSAMPLIRGHRALAGAYVAVSLIDTGSGIPRDKLAQIFEPFFTTKEVGKGTGLGLSQVYGFAKQSGGDVEVESEVGRGSTFTLYLPRVAGDAAADISSEEKGSPAIEEGRGRRVLVVEDNVEVGTFSTQILQDLGYETTWAANADEALKLLSEVNGFDAVFSDVVMPGTSGVELGYEIRRRYPGLPVVLTSGYSHVLAEEGRHGFELLQKPYAVEDLSRVLRRVARTRQPA